MTALQDTQKFQKYILDFDNLDEQIERSMDLLLNERSGEITELKEAVEAKDKGNIVKEALDCIVVITGLLEAIGVDVERSLKVVNQSNMSKFCFEHEITEAKQYFDNKGIKTYTRFMDDQVIGFYSAECQQKDGKHYPQHKLLKPPHYKPVDESIWG